MIQGTGEPLGDREVKEGEAGDLAVFHTKGSRSTKTQACQAEKLSCLGGLEAGCWRSRLQVPPGACPCLPLVLGSQSGRMCFGTVPGI